MTVALVVALAGWAVTVWLLVQHAARAQRSHARREDLLLNQLLHLSGRTWQPPPAEQWTAAKDGDPLVREFEWTATPEQQPYV